LHAVRGGGSVCLGFIGELAHLLFVAVGHDHPDQRLIPTDYNAMPWLWCLLSHLDHSPCVHYGTRRAWRVASAHQGKM